MQAGVSDLFWASYFRFQESLPLSFQSPVCLFSPDRSGSYENKIKTRKLILLTGLSLLKQADLLSDRE